MKPLFLLLLSLTLLTSCAHSYRDTSLFQRSGGEKAVVALLPVIDSVQDTNIVWDLSEEFTARLQTRIFDSSRLYLLKGVGDLETAYQLNAAHPHALTKEQARRLGAAEYAIVTELVEQTEVPYGLSKAKEDKPFTKEVGRTLHVAMRVRVIDLRKERPLVILQEIVHEDYDITRPYLSTDYNRNTWGKEAFERTPMGIVHSRLTNEVVAHAEGYIRATRG